MFACRTTTLSAEAALADAEDELRTLFARIQSQEEVCKRLEQEQQSQSRTNAMLEERRTEIKLKTGKQFGN